MNGKAHPQAIRVTSRCQLSILPRFALGAIGISALFLLARGLALLTFYPWWCGDSAGYTGPMLQVWEGQFEGLDGARTPTYPLFLGLIQLLVRETPAAELSLRAAEVATYVQSLLSLLAIGCLYYVGRRVFRLSRPAALWAAAIFASSTCYSLYDRLILTESLSTSLLLFSVAGLTAVEHFAERLGRGHGLALKLGTGLCLGAATLIRPNLIVFIAAIVLGISFARIRRRLRQLRPLDVKSRVLGMSVSLSDFFPSLVVAAVLVGSWISANYANTGYAKLSNYEGFSLATRAYDCMDGVAAEYPALAKIMIERNDKYEKAGVVKEDIVNEASAEIFQAADTGQFDAPIAPCCGRRTADVNAYLARAMRAAIANRPARYLRNVWRSIERLPTFDTPQHRYDSASDPRVPEIGGRVSKSEFRHRAFFRLSDIFDRFAVFVLWGFYLMPVALIAKSVRRLVDLRLATTWLGIVGMNVITCFITGWVNRYAVVTFPFCLLFVVWLASILWRRGLLLLRRRQATADGAGL